MAPLNLVSGFAALSLIVGSTVAHGVHYNNEPRQAGGGPSFPGRYRAKTPLRFSPPRRDPNYVAPGPVVNGLSLEKNITRGPLLAGGRQLQAFSDRYDAKDRTFGGPAHSDTVLWIYDQVSQTGAYDTWLQEYIDDYVQTTASLVVDGISYVAQLASDGPAGQVTGDLVPVANLGCSATDYPAAVRGEIALISRGTCTFGDKVRNASAAGAIGAIIYNNVNTPLNGVLGEPGTVPFVPTLFISQADGQTLVKKPAGTQANSNSTRVVETRKSYNVLAQSKSGNIDNVVMLGAHTDAVTKAPGINDNGSGSIGILNVAKALAGYKLNNAVRFGWWTAEEIGLRGSTYYVENLARADLRRIALYLNFDMIASPNYVLGIYDGDGNAFNQTGPAGSAEIEHLFEKYFRDRGISTVPKAFTGRSDYGPFIEFGVASGGLFTGADEIKTAAEARIFGGTAGLTQDPCYHSPCDTVNNLNMNAFEINAKSIAWMIGRLANNLRDVPVFRKERRALEDFSSLELTKRMEDKEKNHFIGCSHEHTS